MGLISIDAPQRSLKLQAILVIISFISGDGESVTVTVNGSPIHCGVVRSETL